VLRAAAPGPRARKGGGQAALAPAYDAGIVLPVRTKVTGESTVRRVLLPLAVVFAVLATAGWIARGDAPPPGAVERQLAAWQRGSVAGRPLPEPDAPPERVAGFFDGLTREQRLRLAREYPLVVGNLDGAPLPLRYHANRIALAAAERAERERSRDPHLSAEGQREAGRKANRYASLMKDGRQIIAFDPTGRGRAAEVYGDLAAADRITIVVPGVNTEILNFERTNGKYTAPAGMAEALYQEQRAVAPGAETAVIAWADYEAPTGVALSAATAGLAETGAERLLRFLRALPQDAGVTLACHSYGSVVCGIAADSLPPAVTDIAVAGSPGMRAGSVTDLGTRARVWAMRAQGDWIEDVPHLEIGPLGHGADPVSASFGARRLGTGAARGHDGYFVPGAESLTNLARVGAGDVNDVRCAPGTERCAPFDPCATPG
jgi:hypothetical protein